MTDPVQTLDLSTANKWLKGLLKLLPVWQAQHDPHSSAVLGPSFLLVAVSDALKRYDISTVITQYNVDYRYEVDEDVIIDTDLYSLFVTAHTIRIEGLSTEYDTKGHDNLAAIIQRERVLNESNDIDLTKGVTFEIDKMEMRILDDVFLSFLIERAPLPVNRAVIDLEDFLSAHLLSIKLNEAHSEVRPSPLPPRL